MQENLSVSSLDQTLNIGKKLGANLKGGEVVELAGDLGSGKTSFVKGLASGAGSKDLVSSPSFTICNEYKASNFKIYHFDFYRLSEPGIIKRELAEALESNDAVIVIEWPAVIENILPDKRIVIKLTPSSESGRQITIDYPKELSYLVRGLS